MARWLLIGSCLLTTLVAVGYRDVQRQRAPDAKPLGAICENTHECRWGTSCMEVEGVMRGQCSASCNANVRCTESFGGNSLCLGADVCARTCRSSAECPSQMRCNASRWCARPEVEAD